MVHSYREHRECCLQDAGVIIVDACMYAGVCECMCVCMCVRERERERERFPNNISH